MHRSSAAWIAHQFAGIDTKRKKALLHHFGAAQAVRQAGLADLEAVEGISHAVAQRIVEHFHSAA